MINNFLRTTNRFVSLTVLYDLSKMILKLSKLIPPIIKLINKERGQDIRL